MLPFSVFDNARLMHALRRGLIDGIPPLSSPTDEALIACVVAHGMPRWSADQMRYNPSLRLQFYMFHSDVAEAARGHKEAKERVDAAITAWQEMRKAEVVSDNPEGSVGFWER